MTFEEIAQEVCQNQKGAYLDEERLIGDGSLETLQYPLSRRWVYACQAWVRGGPSPDEFSEDIQSALNQLDPYTSLIARAHQLFSRRLTEAGERKRTDEWFKQISEEIGEEIDERIKRIFTIGFLRDMEFIYRPHQPHLRQSQYGVPPSDSTYPPALLPRQALDSESVNALFVDTETEDGVVLDLTLDLMPDGNGELYPAPMLEFVERDEDFCEAEVQACQLVKDFWPKGYDVRWRLTRHDQEQLPPKLGGNSVGGAFALVLAKLFTRWSEVSTPDSLKPLKRLDLSSVAITAAVEEGGKLAEIGGTFKKLSAAATERSGFFGRTDGGVDPLVKAAQNPVLGIHAVIVSEKQRSEIEAINPSLLESKSYAPFRVFCANHISEVVEMLGAQARQGEIIDCTLELNRHEKVIGREWLHAKAENHKSGYLLILAGPIGGKSAFIAERIRRSQQPAVSHFIKQGMGNWDEPDAIWRSVIAQLRRKYRLPIINTEEGENPKPLSAVFRDVLWQVSESLGDGEKEVIYFDGLDEAFGETGRFAPEILSNFLPKMLPEGIIIVLTSRPDKCLNGLDLQGLETLHLDDKIEENREDIAEYMHLQNNTRHLGLKDEFIDRLVDASGGVFGIAELYLRERENLHSELQQWRETPQKIPSNLTEWLAGQWYSIVTAADQQQIPEDAVRGILGMLVTAREPLSNDQLSYAFFSAVQHDPNARFCFLEVYEIGKHIDKILGLSQGFFRTPSPAQDVTVPCRFHHTSFPEFIDQKLKRIERKECHRLLAEAGLSCWKKEEVLRDYAIGYLPTHLVASEQWEPLKKILSNTTFIDAKLERDMIDDVIAAMAAAQKEGVSLERISQSLVEVLEKKERSDSLWRELHSAVNESFGFYPDWPKSLQKCLEASENLNVMFFLGSVHDMERRHDKAIHVFKKMLRIVDEKYGIENKEYLIVYSIVRELVAALRHYADRLRREGRREDANRRLEEALAVATEYINLPIAGKEKEGAYWWCWYQRAIARRELHQYDQSSEELEVLLKKEEFAKGIRVSTLHQLGVLELELGLLEQAEKRFMECLNKRNGRWNHRRAYELRRLAQICALTGRFEEARKYFDEARGISRRCADWRYVRKILLDRKLFVDLPLELMEQPPEKISLAQLADELKAQLVDELKAQLVDQFDVDESDLDVDESDLANSFRVLSQQTADDDEEKDYGYVQVIDEASAQPTGGIVRRDVAHRDPGDWHATVTVLAFDSQGNLALQKRDEEPRGKLDASVAGHKEVGERGFVAAARETREELGIIIGAQRLIPVGKPYEFRKEGSPEVEEDRHESRTYYVYHTPNFNRERVSLFLLVVSDKEKKQIVKSKPGRVQGFEWVPPVEAREMAEANPGDFASAFKSIHDGTWAQIDRLRAEVQVMKKSRVSLINRFKEITEKAAQIALDYYTKGVHASMKKDSTIATEADEVVERFLSEAIRQAIQAVGSTVRIFGEEENRWSGPADAEYSVIIDPIDGTSLFANRLSIWGVSIAVFQRKQMLFGGFAMPARSQTYFASPLEVTLNDEPLAIEAKPKPITSASYLGVSSDTLNWNLAYPGKIRSFGSSGFHVVAVTSGTLSSSLLTRFKFYDLAGSFIIHKMAGGTIVHYPSGEAVDPSEFLRDKPPSNTPILVCHPDQVDELIQMEFTHKPSGRIGDGDGREMVRIDGGEFLMGTDAKKIPELVEWANQYYPHGNPPFENPIPEASWFEVETPRHTVKLDPFYMDKYPVTNAQYRKFVEATGHPEPREIYYADGEWREGFEPWKDRNFNPPDQPVVCVNWFDAVAYAQWAGKRLPTEAEWEYAARGGLVGKEYPWGDEDPDETRCNFAKSGYQCPTPVGTYAPNDSGLYDIVGNVWEWCVDEYDGNFYAQSPRANPVAGEYTSFDYVNFTDSRDVIKNSSKFRVLRGGSWHGTPGALRIARRGRYRSVATDHFIGFRCARSINP